MTKTHKIAGDVEDQSDLDSVHTLPGQESEGLDFEPCGHCMPGFKQLLNLFVTKQEHKLSQTTLFNQIMAEINKQTTKQMEEVQDSKQMEEVQDSKQPAKASLAAKPPRKPRAKRTNPIKNLQDKIQVVEQKQEIMETDINGVKAVVKLHVDILRGRQIQPAGDARPSGECANCGSKYKYGTNIPITGTSCKSTVCHTAINTYNQKNRRFKKLKSTVTAEAEASIVEPSSSVDE
jgi:hypothetical protein